MIVADCSIIAPLFIETATTPLSRDVYAADPDWVMPLLWRSELRNVARNYLARTAITLDEAVREMSRAEVIFAESDRVSVSSEILGIASAKRISAYGAEYVALATRLGLTLVTEDRRLPALFPDVAVGARRYLDRHP